MPDLERLEQELDEAREALQVIARAEVKWKPGRGNSYVEAVEAHAWAALDRCDRIRENAAALSRLEGEGQDV